MPAVSTEPRPLRVVRLERVLSMKDLARLARVAPSTIYCTETGRTVPSLAVMRRIAAALDVDALAVTEFRHAIQARAGQAVLMPPDGGSD